MLNNNYINDGIVKDAIGYILEIYDEGYCEVEFSDAKGITIAVQVINREDYKVLGNKGRSGLLSDFGNSICFERNFVTDTIL